MWKQDLEALLKVWPDSRLIKKLEAVFGGIAITDTSENQWFYDHNEGTLTQKSLQEEHHKDDKDKDDELKPRNYDDIYEKMREYADRRDYTLSVEEAEIIIDQCEEEGDSIFDCSDGMLREIVEDWIADHSCLGKYF